MLFFSILIDSPSHSFTQAYAHQKSKNVDVKIIQLALLAFSSHICTKICQARGILFASERSNPVVVDDLTVRSELLGFPLVGN